MSKALSERYKQEAEARNRRAWEMLRELAYQAAEDETKVDAAALAEALEEVDLSFDDFERLIEVALQRQEARAAIANKKTVESESAELDRQLAELDAERQRYLQALDEKLRPLQARRIQLRNEIRRIEAGANLLDQAPTDELRDERRALRDRLQRLQSEQKGSISSWRRETIGPEIDAVQHKLAEVERQIWEW